MSGPIQSWKIQLEEALSHSNKGKAAFTVIVNPKFILSITKRPNTCGATLTVTLMKGNDVSYYFREEDKEHFEKACSMLTALMYAL